MTEFTTESKRGLYAIGFLLLIVIVFYTLIIGPSLSARTDNAERIDDLIFQIDKFSHAGHSQSLLQAEINQLKIQNQEKKDFLENNSPAIVAADLQKMIKTLVESSGGNLVSTHALDKNEEDLFPKITVKVHMRADITTIQNVLYQLIVNKPLLFTDNILIQKRQSNSRKRQQAVNILDMRFDISGYLSASKT